MSFRQLRTSKELGGKIAWKNFYGPKSIKKELEEAIKTKKWEWVVTTIKQMIIPENTTKEEVFQEVITYLNKQMEVLKNLLSLEPIIVEIPGWEPKKVIPYGITERTKRFFELAKSGEKKTWAELADAGVTEEDFFAEEEGDYGPRLCIGNSGTIMVSRILVRDDEKKPATGDHISV